MPKKTQYPKPVKRWHNGAWQILWRYAGRQYSVSTKLFDERRDAVFADLILRQFALALAKDEPDFPPDYSGFPAVARYTAARYGTQSDGPSGEWIEEYSPVLDAECTPVWAAHSKRYLRALEMLAGGITDVTPGMAQGYLTGIISAGKSPATRNRALAACKRFYGWAIRTGRIRVSPFTGISALPEAKHGEIVYCTKEERRTIIELARAAGWQDWLAVPIAFYAGMRRGRGR